VLGRNPDPGRLDHRHAPTATTDGAMIPTIVLPGVYTIKVMDVRLRDRSVESGRYPMYCVKFETPSGHEIWDWFADVPADKFKWQVFGIGKFADLPSISGRYYMATVVTYVSSPYTSNPVRLFNRIKEYLVEVEYG
jgi:hypothetical protein